MQERMVPPLTLPLPRLAYLALAVSMDIGDGGVRTPLIRMTQTALEWSSV